jgi:hypothetical protein
MEGGMLLLRTETYGFHLYNDVEKISWITAPLITGEKRFFS